jgi:hypothetical protein
MEDGEGSREEKAESRKQKTESREKKAENRKQNAWLATNRPARGGRSHLLKGGGGRAGRATGRPSGGRPNPPAAKKIGEKG